MTITMDNKPGWSECALAMSVQSLDQLMDDVLVGVLAYLSVEDVLACRLVCKRLAVLAAHRDVWRHRWLSLDHDNDHAGAVLRLAPCLKRISVAVRTLPLVTTRCAIKNLDLRDDDGQPVNATDLALAVRVQEALGRLRDLKLWCRTQVTGADALMRTLAATSGLQSLEFVGRVPSTTHRVTQGAPWPSLKKFHCELTKDTESFVNAVLAAHADTLEEVTLFGGSIHDVGYTGDTPDTTVRLLAGMPRLSFLGCEPLPGLQAVAACESLTRVCLRPHSFGRRAVEGAAQLLSIASGQLRSVAMSFTDHNDEEQAEEHGDKLIEALGAQSSAGSALEWLGVYGPPRLYPLIRVLPLLPALRELTVHTACFDSANELLSSLTPETAPSLREFGFKSNLFTDCTHEWLHADNARKTSVKNPLLHIRVLETFDCEHCDACKQDCHKDIKWGLEELGLFSHELGQCPSSPLPHDTEDPYWPCFWIQMRESPAS